ncbi:MAG TPA: hypothetical protein VGU69_18425, partial [Rhizomicrobium sp.]|nr:hypothetical protein [Rhizomicrobium sp.]
DQFPISDLSFVMAAEALSAERIEDENCTGNEQCERATATSAAAIKKAIEGDRLSRQKRLALTR